MDFFSAAHPRSPPVVLPDVHSFPVTVAPNAQPTRLTPLSAASDPFAVLLPADLRPILDDPRTLLVDIRPHAAHAHARLPRALSLSVPSTLLKRPLFSLERLSEMLHSSAARHRFLAFNDSARIVVYDADSSIINESSNIYGLLRKFRSAHFTGELAWLRGGFQAVWREQRQLVDTGPQAEEHDSDDTDDTAAVPSTGTLCTRRLPMSAFGPMSTTLPRASPLPPALATNPFFDAVRQNTELSHGITERIPLRLPNRVRRRISDLPFSWIREIARRADRIPRPRTALSRSHSHIQACTSHGAYSRTQSLSRISCDRHHDSLSFEDLSESEASPSAADVEEGTETLAMQFYRIEVAEQRRLMGVMEHHSKESRHPAAVEFLPRKSFPFSITAGVEKGSKNRYQHIWPFEHARVKLCQTGREGKDVELDDYVNASFVQPLGTTKNYIATQGPLEATFEDFWRLIWQQNVHVIVMLTQEVENSMVKCGTYWADSTPAMRERTFGMLRVTLVAKMGLPGGVDLMHQEPPASANSGGVFGFGGGCSYGTQDVCARKQRSRVTTIKRTFRLEHRGYPNVGPREVVQLQYLEWADMNVPEDARGVLGLVREVEKAVGETEEPGESLIDRRQGELERHGDVDPLSGVACHVMGGRRPVLLHCSAGVGRTGCFIALDAVLDGIRREVRENMDREKGKYVDENGIRDTIHEEMDVDAPRVMIAKDALTVPLPQSGEPSPMLRSASAGHVHAIAAPSSHGSQMDDTAMKVEGEVQQVTQRTVELEKSATASGMVSQLLSSSHPAPDGGAPLLQKHPPTTLAMNLSPSSASASSSGSTLASGSVFPSFSESQSRLRGGNKARDSSLATSISSVGSEASSKDRVGDGHVRFRTASAPQSQMLNRKSKLHLSLGSGAGAGLSPLARSSSAGDIPFAQPEFSAHSITVDYREPRTLHAFPETPVALSTFDEPIWEVVQDMREQRMSLCSSLRQYVFMHQVVIEGALQIVDEEKERARKDGMIHRSGKEGEMSGGDVKLTISPSPLPGGVSFSFGTDRAVMGRSNTFPLLGPQVRSQSTSRQSFDPPLSLNLSDAQSLNSPSSAGGLSSDSGSPASSTMKRGASPTELLKEGKKGEPLLYKRPSIKRISHELKEDTQGSVPAVLETVPPSPIMLQ